MAQELANLKMKLILILMAFAFVMPYPQQQEESEPVSQQDNYTSSIIINYLKRIELRQKRTIKILKNIEYFILTMDEAQLEYEKPEAQIVNKRMNSNQKEMAISSILNKIKSNG